MNIKLKKSKKKKAEKKISIIEINNIEKLHAKRDLNKYNDKTKYSNILKEIRYSLSLLESYRNEYNDEDVKIYIPVKSNVKKNTVSKTKYFSRKSIYLCLKTIVENGKKNNLSLNETFKNVNQYIDLLDSEHLIDEDYYSWIKTAENISQTYWIFLMYILEEKNFDEMGNELEKVNTMTKTYYIKNRRKK